LGDTVKLLGRYILPSPRIGNSDYAFKFEQPH